MAFAEKTEVPVARTRAEIEALLTKYKARKTLIGIDLDRLIAHVQFGLHDRIVRFVIKLPDPKRLSVSKYEQAMRRIWRALLLVIKAKLESVASTIETFEEAFLANIVLPGDQTVAEVVRDAIAEAYRSGRPLMLTAGGDVVDGAVVPPTKGQ